LISVNYTWVKACETKWSSSSLALSLTKSKDSRHPVTTPMSRHWFFNRNSKARRGFMADALIAEHFLIRSFDSSVQQLPRDLNTFLRSLEVRPSLDCPPSCRSQHTASPLESNRIRTARKRECNNLHLAQLLVCCIIMRPRCVSRFCEGDR